MPNMYWAVLYALRGNDIDSKFGVDNRFELAMLLRSTNANAIFLPVATDKPASFTLITRRTKDAREAAAVEMETSARSRKKYGEPYN
ncbi:hypothetical protein TELCIR_20052 [Teladorsagia circumcincta]|uniref:Uncharacterized protein n=1 Tax=Teladorsagia circumcincta TaxID=45464 RepID=A0A2G9TM05_TELCI|nr:hypothetical protein TELCIR_20052 [Teladorsagia circumcincta]